MGPTNEAGAVHRRVVELYAEVMTGHPEAALALIDADVVDHRGGADGDHRGIEAWRAKWEAAAAAARGDGAGLVFDEVTIEQNVAAGDTSVNRYTMRGTDAATGRSFVATGLDMVRVRDGRLVEHWAVADLDAIRHQLGAAPSAGEGGQRQLP